MGYAHTLDATARTAGAIMTKRICDRCGSEKGVVQIVCASWYQVFIDSMNNRIEKDLCEECVRALNDFFNSQPQVWR